jgi:hypothetical protein
LFDLIYRSDESVKKLRRVRCEIVAQFPVNVILNRIEETGLMNKFALCVVCDAGQIHGGVPQVCYELETHFPGPDDKRFVPVCDAFFFADRRRCIDFALNRGGFHSGLRLLDSIFQKFTEGDVMAFVRCWQFNQLLRLEFGPEVEVFAVNLLFTFVYRAKKANLDGQWEQLFEIGSHVFDSSKGQCRLAALKIITALFVNPATGTHLHGNLTRIQHIVEVASEDWEKAEIRKIGDLLKQIKAAGD